MKLPPALALCCGLLLFGAQRLFGDDIAWRTGVDRRQRWEQPTHIALSRRPLRDALREIARETRLAILIDRRIDPEQFVSLNWNGPFSQMIGQFAAERQLKICSIGDCAFLTTADTAATLRTRIALAEEQRLTLSGTARQRLELGRRRPFLWSDLATPRALVAESSRQLQTGCENPEAIPHDLWAAAVVPSALPTEFLSIIACQFDLQVEWLAPDRFRFVAVDPAPACRREIKHPGRSLADLETLIKEHRLALTLQPQAGKTIGQGRIEEIESLQKLLQPGSARSKPEPATESRFTLRAERQAFRGLLATLERQGFELIYDEASLAAAGVDLDQRVTLELSDVTLHELLTAACSPLRLEFEVEQRKITLRPAR